MPIADTNNTGYMFNVVPRSTEELIKVASHEKITTNTKNAIRWYIDSFMNTKGVNRQLTSSITSHSLQYVTDKSLSSDPTLRQTQLAELYNDLIQKSPAILVSDTGITTSPMKPINPLDGVAHIDSNQKWLGRHYLTRNVGISVNAITSSKGDTNDLVSLIGILFEELRNISHLGNFIHAGHVDEQANWVVQLPLIYTQNMSQALQMQDDPTQRDQLWSAEIIFEAIYQAWFDIQAPLTDTSSITGVVDTPQDQLLTFQMDSTTNVNTDLAWSIPGYLPGRYKIAVDDWKIATLDLDTRLFHPRRPGTVNMLLMDNTGKVLDSKQIIVTAT